jgi:hypothetical protein
MILFECTNADSLADRVVSLRLKEVDKDIRHGQRYKSRRDKERERISLNLSILACDSIEMGLEMGRQAEGATLGILVVSFSIPMPVDEELPAKQSSQFSVLAKSERTRTRLVGRTVVLAVVFPLPLNSPLVSGP